MASSVDFEQLWPQVAAAQKASHRGTELIKELRDLLVRGDPFSEQWQQDRIKIRTCIEAHVSGERHRDDDDRSLGSAGTYRDTTP